MGEAVAIISVSASAVVGIGGLVAAAWGSSRERRWQSQEERTKELRGVLDRACEKLTQQLVVLDQAHREFSTSGAANPMTQQLLVETEKQLVLECNRLAVRRGSHTPEYVALGACREAATRVSLLLNEMATGAAPAQRGAYSTLWDDVLTAEKRFLDVASDALTWEEPAPFWRRLRQPQRAL
jgi:hypothetical protein